MKPYNHHSPSSTNKFITDRAGWVLKNYHGIELPVGPSAHRGTAVEAGVALGLVKGAPIDTCIAEAIRTYDTLTALSSGKQREACRAQVPGMVERSLAALLPVNDEAGCTPLTQGRIERHPEGLKYPITGYYDFYWPTINCTIDLKTIGRYQGEIRSDHARQVAFYIGGGGHGDGRLAYCFPTKFEMHQLEDAGTHYAALVNIARRVEIFLARNPDAASATDAVLPDIETFYWNSPRARLLAREMWGI